MGRKAQSVSGVNKSGGTRRLATDSGVVAMLMLAWQAITGKTREVHKPVEGNPGVFPFELVRNTSAAEKGPGRVWAIAGRFWKGTQLQETWVPLSWASLFAKHYHESESFRNTVAALLTEERLGGESQQPTAEKKTSKANVVGVSAETAKADIERIRRGLGKKAPDGLVFAKLATMNSAKYSTYRAECVRDGTNATDALGLLAECGLNQ